MNKPLRYSGWLIIPLLIIMISSVFVISKSNAYFTDIEESNGSAASGWTSMLWTQTTDTDFDNGVSDNIEIFPSGDASLAILPIPALISSDTAEVYTLSNNSAQLIKILYFTKSGSDYDEIRIDSNQKIVGGTEVTCYIRLNSAEIFTHTTSSSDYQTYQDTFDLSGYADGEYMLELYMIATGGNGYNSLFEIYTTSPTLVASDNASVSHNGNINYTLKKSLSFTKSGSAYNNLRIGTNLRISGGNTAGWLKIEVDNTLLYEYSTKSTTFITDSHVLDFSGYADGLHTVSLYLKCGNSSRYSYNSFFEIWRTDPAFVVSDNNEYSVSGTLEWQLMKWQTFYTTGPTFAELRIDSNLKSSGALVESSLRIDDVQVAYHSTQEQTYQYYQDVIDTSGLSSGSHTLKLYMKSGQKNKSAYNSQMDLYRTHSYASVGTIASQVLNNGLPGCRWDALFWDESLANDTYISFEVRASDTPFLKTDTELGWIAVGSESPVLTVPAAGQYMQWRATLNTADTEVTPSLSEVRVYYAGKENIVTSITDMDPIIGTTMPGNSLTAGAITPAGATVTYQWQYSDGSGSTFTDIEGATSNTFEITGGDYIYSYLRVEATGTGDYTGTLNATTLTRVSASSTPVTSISTISGVAKVGEEIYAGTLSPPGATATYQWQWCATENGTFTNISGATSNSYTLQPGDYSHYLKVVATGSGSYSETVDSASIGPVASAQITGISPIIGTTVVGQVLTAGTLTPSNATVIYQWQWCMNSNGTYTNISGATNNTYTISSDDNGLYIKVMATGSGVYTGNVTSDAAGPVTTSATPVTGISDIVGTPQVSQLLTAGTLSPSGATATYQWQRSTSENGTYANISGASSLTYTVQPGDTGYYIKVIATGSGGYSDYAVSNPIGPVTSGILTAIGPITGTTAPGYTLTAGAVTPAGATVDYQWQYSDVEGVTYTDIPLANSSTYYILDLQYSYCYLRVIATGTGSFAGSANATTATRVSGSSTPITNIEPITGTARVSQLLAAGDITPSAATVIYQWQRGATENGTFTDIPGATSGTYKLQDDDYGYYIKVVAMGTGGYSETLNAVTAAPVAAGIVTDIDPIGGTSAIGQVLAAGTLTPSEATVTYRWQRSASENGTYANISGAAYSTYTLLPEDVGYYIKVTATGFGFYTGNVTSDAAGPVITSSTPITGIGAISGTLEVGQTLNAGTLTPPEATATYQWQRSVSENGTYINISGASSSTYTLQSGDIGYYIKVIATGTGSYSETAVSNPTGPVSGGEITGIGPIIGSTQVGSTLTAGAVTPAGATVTYQWQYSDAGDGTTFTDIPNATSSTYYIQNWEYSWRYIRVVVTGTGSYTGTASATTTTRVG